MGSQEKKRLVLLQRTWVLQAGDGNPRLEDVECTMVTSEGWWACSRNMESSRLAVCFEVEVLAEWPNAPAVPAVLDEKLGVLGGRLGFVHHAQWNQAKCFANCLGRKQPLRILTESDGLGIQMVPFRRFVESQLDL